MTLNRFFRCTGAALLALSFAGTAAAQSNSSGNITGRANAGDTIVVESYDTGLHREVIVPESGRYRLNRLPLGDYSVVIKRADGSLSPPSQVSLRVGATARVDDPKLKKAE